MKKIIMINIIILLIILIIIINILIKKYNSSKYDVYKGEENVQTDVKENDSDVIAFATDGEYVSCYKLQEDFINLKSLKDNYEKVDILSVSEFINTPPTILNSNEDFKNYKMKYENFKLITDDIWDNKSVIVDIYSNYNHVIDLKVTNININEKNVIIDLAVCEVKDNLISNSIPYVIICDKIDSVSNVKINITRYKPTVTKHKEIPYESNDF